MRIWLRLRIFCFHVAAEWTNAGAEINYALARHQQAQFEKWHERRRRAWADLSRHDRHRELGILR